MALNSNQLSPTWCKLASFVERHMKMRVLISNTSWSVIYVRVGQSYVPVDFVVLEIGGDARAPIILGRPFLSTAKAIIYVNSAKIYFIIKDKKEKFSFNYRILQSPGHP